MIGSDWVMDRTELGIPSGQNVLAKPEEAPAEVLKPTSAAQVASLGPLQAAMPKIEAYVKAQSKALDNKIFALLDKFELDPQQAVQAWQERRLLRRLVNSLDGSLLAMQSVGARLKSFLDNDGDNNG